jgi:hypothetical protein
MAEHAEAGEAGVRPVPDWAVREMPRGYQTRMEEIERLWAEIREMERFGWLLCETGRPLEQAVHDAFAALKTEPAADGAESQFVVKLDGKRRLLVYVADTDALIQKQSDALERVFHLLQKEAGEHDRVVLVANVDRMRPPAERSASLAPDALALLKRLGANFLSSPTLFAIWMLSFQDMPRARGFLDKLHALEGGTFTLPAA